MAMAGATFAGLNVMRSKVNELPRAVRLAPAW
jgi:hypothetical protein